MIALPDIRQKGTYDCGAACVDTVFAALGIRASAALLGLSNGIQGTAPDTVEAMLRAARLPVVSGTMTVKDLKHFTDDGRPVICPITLPDGGHWVVVRGVARLIVHLQCPVDGPMTRTVKQWMGIWSDRSRSGQLFDRWGIAVG